MALTKTVNLYTTLGCHLCDDALKLLDEYSTKTSPLDIVEIEIADSDVLVDRYGIRIPVIQLPTNQLELGWPFDSALLKVFLTKT
ncbi:MAG: glutaredoxin family protein [Pseudomonadales bacterium]|nr:glutaredoxin family protein [Pseudomonadales bacterium]